MFNKLEITIDVIVHATEDISKILQPFDEILEIKEEEFKIDNLANNDFIHKLLLTTNSGLFISPSAINGINKFVQRTLPVNPRYSLEVLRYFVDNGLIIEEQGVLKNELKEQILGCKSMTSLEDLYLPYKPKRKTKAEIARKLGLEPLAGTLMRQDVSDVINLAKRFVKGGVTDEEAALAGARDIMAEWISERTAARENVRKHFLHSAIIRSKVVKGKDDADSKFRDYFDFDQPLKKCPGHRFLAMKRAEDEGVIRLSLTPLRPEGIERLERYFIRRDGPTSEQIKLAIADSYKRLLEPSIETTPRSKLTPKPFKFLLRT